MLTWYHKKQCTLTFQEKKEGPFCKDKWVNLIQDKPGTLSDLPNSNNEQTLEQKIFLLAEKDIKHSLTILEKQVEANTRSLSINPQNQDNITNEALFETERCKSLQATLYNKHEEIFFI